MTHWDNTPPPEKTTFYVGKQRKDGKHLVTYCYARRIRKLETPERVKELLNDSGFKLGTGIPGGWK